MSASPPLFHAANYLPLSLASDLSDILYEGVADARVGKRAVTLTPWTPFNASMQTRLAWLTYWPQNGHFSMSVAAFLSFEDRKVLPRSPALGPDRKMGADPSHEQE